MDSTPPSNRSLRIKSASRFARTVDFSCESEEKNPKHLSPELPPSSPNRTPKPLNHPLPLHELLLLSPSPAKRSKTRLADRLEIAEELAVEPVSSAGSRRRCKSRAYSQLGCSSPRNARKSRRRAELEVREEKELSLAEEIGRVRKRRNSGRTRKEKPSLAVPSLPPSSSSPRSDINGDDGINLERIAQLLNDLVMWNDASKSSLWFGLGSICFFSACFSKEINFSIFSAISQLSLLLLGVSFFSNSYFQRGNVEKQRNYKLKEDDILRVARLVLPAANLAISKIRELFSGDPSTTLKVVPFFLLGAEYGHLLTLRRLCAIGFFASFTIPKLYSCYSAQINKQVEYLKWWVLETWGACSHKKVVAASVVTAFWNLSSVKARIFAAFISLVIYRYRGQLPEVKLQGEEKVPQQQQQQQEQALVLAEGPNAKS